MLAARHPRRVARLAAMESLLGALLGAERFLAAGLLAARLATFIASSEAGDASDAA